jgi:hypothetical protein
MEGWTSWFHGALGCHPVLIRGSASAFTQNKPVELVYQERVKLRAGLVCVLGAELNFSGSVCGSDEDGEPGMRSEHHTENVSYILTCSFFL